MEESTNLFEGDITTLESVVLEAPLRDAKQPCCERYTTAYEKAVKSCEEGQEQQAAVYKFLSIVTGIRQTYHVPGEPYGPKWAFDGMRSPIPVDLTDEDLSAIEAILSNTKDSALRARLYDLVWLSKKDHKACAAAAELYFEAADKLNTDDGWTFAEPCYWRGLDLARLLGRGKELYSNLSARMIEVARKSAAEKGYRCLKYLELLLQFQIGDLNVFARVAEEIAASFEKDKEFKRAQDYWETAATYWKRAKDNDAARRCRLVAGEALVSQAEQRIDGPNKSALAAASLLQRGIEALRQVDADPERVKVLRALLAKYQKASLKEMRTVSTTVDITDAVEQTRELIRGKSFEEALFSLAFGDAPLDPIEMRRKVDELVEQAPISQMAPFTLVDDMGRPIEHDAGLFQKTEADYEKALEARIFNAAQKLWKLRASAYIEPARLVVLEEHYPSLADIVFCVRYNPFVPPQHEYTYLRGIHAGFHGDFHVAASLLVPQIENSLRHILEMQGIDVSNLHSDGTQPLKILSGLLGIPELETTIGAELRFELRGILLENSGFNFRNRLCHGFVSDEDFNSVPAVNIWWLVLRLCLVTIYNLRDNQEVESDE